MIYIPQACMQFITSDAMTCDLIERWHFRRLNLLNSKFFKFQFAVVSSTCVTSGLNPSCKKNSAAASRHSHTTGCSSSSYPFFSISTALISQSFFLVMSDLARQSTASAMLCPTASSALSLVHRTSRILFSALSSSAIS